MRDGGAQHFSDTINQIKLKCPSTTIEVLTPDFRNKKNAIELLARRPIDVFNHNWRQLSLCIETLDPVLIMTIVEYS